MKHRSIRTLARASSLGIVALALAGCVEGNDHATRYDEPILSADATARLRPLAQPATTRPAAVPEPMFIDVGERTTLIYSCRQAQSEALAAAITGLLSPEGTVQATPALNTLVVSDRAETTRGIAKVLEQMDKRVPQLLVEARVVEVTVSDDLEAEIRNRLIVPNGDGFFQSSDTTLSVPGSTPTIGQGVNLAVRAFSPGDISFDTFVRLLLTRGRAKILSSPNLLVSAGSEASIITGQEVPVQSATVVGTSTSVTTQFKRVGIKLRVNLLQITNDTARIELNPEVSAVTSYVNSGSNGTGDGSQVISNPVIAIRNVTSTLSLRDGEILTVGGLLSTEDRETVRGVPGLMDVPLLGNLFKATRKQRVRTQLIFFLRSHILAPGDPDGIRVHNPDDSMKILDALPKDAVPTTNPATLVPEPGDKPLERT